MPRSAKDRCGQLLIRQALYFYLRTLCFKQLAVVNPALTTKRCFAITSANP
jgi:hypothetical protein